MAFKAVILDVSGEELTNQIPPFVYHFISETLVKMSKGIDVNPLKKYNKEMAFPIFFASCVHNLLLDIHRKKHRKAPSNHLFGNITHYIQNISRVQEDTVEISNVPLITKFLQMIATHTEPRKGENYQEITAALTNLIEKKLGEEGDAALDTMPCLSECLDLISEFKISGILSIEITPELEDLYERYKVGIEHPPARLLWAIADDKNLKALDQLSNLVDLTKIINSQSATGRTVLHWVVKDAQETTIETEHEKYRKTYAWLVTHGADAERLDAQQKTALSYDRMNIFGASFKQDRPVENQPLMSKRS